MANIILLTGFLGAGKTTLLQALIDSYKEKKIGLVVNEFGEVNVDAQLVRKDGVEMAELSNGSIFCACIKDKFVDSLIKLSERDLEYLFIEASGLADPANMGQLLDGIRHKLASPYVLSGNICIVDALHFPDLVELLPALERQVEYANAIVINKADLADPETIREVTAKIREINGDAKVYVTSYCKIDIQDVAGGFAESAKESKETTNTYESRPNAFVLRAGGPVSYDGIQAFLEKIAPQCYRIKGFVKTDRGDIEVSAVMEGIQMHKWDQEIETTELVAISSVGIKLLSTLVAASKEFLDGGLKL